MESLDWVKVGLGLVGWLGWSGLLDNPNKDQVSKYTSLTQKKKNHNTLYLKNNNKINKEKKNLVGGFEDLISLPIWYQIFEILCKELLI